MSEQRKQFALRLNELCDEKGISRKGLGRQKAVSGLFKKTEGAARKWLEGEAFPSWEIMQEMCKWGGVHIDWLFAGIGEKYRSSAPPKDQRIVSVVRALEKVPSDKLDEIKSIVEVMTGSGSRGR